MNEIIQELLPCTRLRLIWNVISIAGSLAFLFIIYTFKTLLKRHKEINKKIKNSKYK